MLTVKENLQHLKREIKEACQRSGRNEADVKIIAVTKYVSDARTLEALEAGIEHIGENRVEEATQKYNRLNGKGTWHFIGSLQSRKVKGMIDQFEYIHSLDRLSLAKEIDKRATSIKKCFVQVNVSLEETKHGLTVEDVLPFIKDLKQYPSIEVVGLMTMAPFVQNPEGTRKYFRKLKELQQDVQALQLPHAPCLQLSMGMSNDFQIAIEEGATFIRVGTALVGE